MEKKASISVRLNGIEIKSNIDGKDFLNEKALKEIKEELSYSLNNKLNILEKQRDAYDEDYVNKSFEFDPEKVLLGDIAQIYYVLYYLSNGRIVTSNDALFSTLDYKDNIFKATDAEKYVTKDALKYIWFSENIKNSEMNRYQHTYQFNDGPKILFNPTVIGIKPFISSVELIGEGTQTIAGYVYRYGIDSLLYISKSDLFDTISRDIFQILIARSVYNKMDNPSKYMSPELYTELILHADFSDLNTMISLDFEELYRKSKPIKDNEYFVKLMLTANKLYKWTPDRLIEDCVKKILHEGIFHSESTRFVSLLDLIDAVNKHKITNSKYYVSGSYISGETIKETYKNMYMDFRSWYSDSIYKILPENANQLFDYLMQFDNDLVIRILYNFRADDMQKSTKPKYAQYYIDKMEEKREYCKERGIQVSE